MVMLQDNMPVPHSIPLIDYLLFWHYCTKRYKMCSSVNLHVHL
jgi:hypothetical protein